MMLLLDTHAFLWLVAGDERLPVSARELVAGAARVSLSAASVWEGEIKRAAGRLDAPPLADAAARTGIEVLDISAAHATLAARLPLHHRDPFDRMLVAQARVERMVLVSRDAVMRSYGVAVAW